MGCFIYLASGNQKNRPFGLLYFLSAWVYIHQLVGGAVGVGTEVGVLLGQWVGGVEAGEHKSQHSKQIPHNSHHLRTKGTVLVPKSAYGEMWKGLGEDDVDERCYVGNVDSAVGVDIGIGVRDIGIEHYVEEDGYIRHINRAVLV